MTDTMHYCPICSGSVTIEAELKEGLKVDRSGQVSPNFVITDGWCAACEVPMSKYRLGESETCWKTSVVDESTIVSILTDEELDELIGSYDLTDYDMGLYNRFLAIKKPQDSIFEYLFQSGGITIRGVVLRRDEHLIGNFNFFVEMDGDRNMNYANN